MDPPDSTLVARALAGDSSAFDELAGRHRADLVRFAALMIGDADEAESLAQEALTRAFARLETFREDLPFGPWLRGIALNLCRNHLRDRARQARLVAPEQLHDAPAREGRRQGVLSAILRREVNDQLARAVAELPMPYREAFLLHFVEGLDYSQASRITGVAAGTLRVRAHRARTLLRHCLGSVVDSWMRAVEPEVPPE
jgi:RNA polymerase sigma-70 factor (ECF subfamily)